MPQLATAQADPILPPEMEVGIVERRDIPGAWAVEAINVAGDGEIYLTVFSGPDAKDRAEEYAAMKYQVA